MIAIYLSTFFIFAFGILNLVGIRSDLVLTQLLFLAEGITLFFIVKKIGRNFFIENSRLFYWFLVFFLLVVLFLAEDVRGSRRWLNFSFVNFQPSEFFKIFFIVYLSRLLADTKAFLSKRGKFFTVLFYFAIPAILIFKQPDLGTTIVLALIFLGLTFFSDIPKKYFFRLILAVSALAPFIWYLIKPYQKIRLLSFITPHLDKKGISYNMIQSIITIGSGGFFGKGLGLGTQARLFFLPENFTDFAFASLVEQFGFFGGLIVVVLFIILLYSLFKKIFEHISFANRLSAFNFYYILGFFIMIFAQIIINIGMNMGIMPITGIPLPLISYGGSSLASFLLGLALLP